MNESLLARIRYGLPESEWSKHTRRTYSYNKTNVVLRVGMMHVITFLGQSYSASEQLKQFLESKKIPYTIDITQDNAEPMIVFPGLPNQYSIRACDLHSVDLTYDSDIIYYEDIPLSVISVAEANIAEKNNLDVIF